MKFNLYVVRHGQTYFNIYNKVQGWSNTPLTEKGLKNAEDTGKRLAGINFKAAYSSDTTRASETCQKILDFNQSNSTNQVITSKLFREEFYGSFEGSDINQMWLMAGGPHGVSTFKEIVDKYSIDRSKDFIKAADPFHHAEDSSEYWQRYNQGLKMIEQNSAIADGDNVLLVTHGNSILSLVDKYGAGKYDLTVRPQNGSYTKLIINDDQIKIDQYNQ